MKNEQENKVVKETQIDLDKDGNKIVGGSDSGTKIWVELVVNDESMVPYLLDKIGR